MHFRSDKYFGQSGTRSAPYAGVSTVLHAPDRQVDPRDPDCGDRQGSVVGGPMARGVTNRPGERFGPRALRDIERIGPYNHVLGCAPVYDMRVADVGDVTFASRFRLAQRLDDIEHLLAKVAAAGGAPP